jgi:hypothetical protein
MPSLTSLRSGGGGNHAGPSGASTPGWGTPATAVGDSYFELQFPGKKDGYKEDEKKLDKKKKRKKAQVFVCSLPPFPPNEYVLTINDYRLLGM